MRRPAMSPAMWVSLAVCLVGVAMIAAYPLMENPRGPNDHYYPMVAGYFTALVGAAALFVSWMVHRSRSGPRP